MEPKTLLGLAQDTSDSGRARLTEAVSDFFKEYSLNENERTLASDILMSLIRQAEIDLRQVLAERLAVEKDIPVDIIAFLANDEISVAQHVLKHSAVLNDIDIVQIIEKQGQDHWKAIAAREKMTPKVVNKLIETSDADTVLVLIENQRVNLETDSIKKIIKMSMLSEVLQAPLLRRPEIDVHTAVDLYMIVSQALREDILRRFSMSGEVVERALDVLVQELCNEARGHSDVSPEMVALAARFAERDDITPALLMGTLRRAQMGFFIALFAAKTGFSSEVVMKMIRNNEGRAFIVVCRHLGMMKSEFASVFLLSRGIRTESKVLDQHELAMALGHFDALKDFDVGRIMKSWLRDPSQV